MKATAATVSTPKLEQNLARRIHHYQRMADGACEIRIPIIDGQNNKDILSYSGIYQSGVVISTPDKEFTWGRRS